MRCQRCGGEFALSLSEPATILTYQDISERFAGMNLALHRRADGRDSDLLCNVAGRSPAFFAFRAEGKPNT